jgi:hypothetical protein
VTRFAFAILLKVDLCKHAVTASPGRASHLLSMPPN